MAKKRGGLAGLYDRNKGLFRTAAILGGTALGGPAGGAAAGAAFRGLDRPGQRGIGFDVGQGVRGAAEGYALGKTAIGAKNAISSMLAPKAAAGMVYNATNVPGIGAGLGGAAEPAGNFWYGGQTPVNMDPWNWSQGGKGNFVTRALDFATKYEKPLGGLVKGVMSQLPSESNQLARENAEFNRRQIELENERQRNIAMMLLPQLDRMLGIQSSSTR